MVTINRKLTWIVVSLIAIVVVLAFFFVKKNYLESPSYLSGDEPHYIMMTDSLSKDGDFNLKNDYELGRSTNYLKGPGLEPHLSLLIDRNSPRWYSIHTIGLPLILAIPYHYFGVDGARVWLMLLQFSLVCTFYLILKKHIKSSTRIWLGVILFLTCPLLWQNLGSIFPDLLIVNIAGLIVLLFGKKEQLSNVVIAALFLLGTLIHSKALVLIGPLVLLHFLWLVNAGSLWNSIKKQWAAIMLLMAGALGYASFLYVNYGVFIPSQLYGGTGQLYSANPIYNVIAMFTDRSKGLFVHYPLLLIATPFVIRAGVDLFKLAKTLTSNRKKYTSNHFLVFGLVAGYLFLAVTLVSFFDWSGSTAPNGRNILPFILAIIFILAKYVNIKNRIELFVLATFSGLCIWLSWLSITNFVYYMSTGVDSFWVDHFPLLKYLPLFNLSSIDFGKPPAILGLKVLAVAALFNLLVFLAINYKVSFAKRTY
jgi:hypothetical protein